MNSWLPSLYTVARAVIISLDVFLFAVIIFSVIKAWKFRPKLLVSEPEERIFALRNAALKERWEGILKRAESGSLESLGAAIIDADNFTDDILQRMGLKGEHIADRLEQLSEDDFASLERLWRAHRVRNQLIHEPDFKLTAETGTEALKNYEAFLKEAEAI